ncbi:MAG TPA: sigma-70 family RNA polymerase sigma factor, partial [Pseudolysinimonas sp.]|nr:sigma-70 family RNA polymerase sigma factor [Pseudolysinimonas sp.]
YDRHAALMHRYAARRVGRVAADDVMSETFLVAFERRASFDLAVDDARPWLYGIATTLLKKHVRLEIASWRGIVAAGSAEVDVDAIEAVGSRLDAETSVSRLGTALRRMHARDRDVLLLHAWADLDYQAIADALNVPIGTVRSRLNRARRVLRAASNRGTVPDQEVGHGRTDPAAQRA